MAIGSVTAHNGVSLKILQAIANERIRQLEKWGVQLHSLAGWSVISSEEIGEYNKAIFDYAQGKGNIEDVIKEGIETCATIVAAIETICFYLDEGRAVPSGLFPTVLHDPKE